VAKLDQWQTQVVHMGDLVPVGTMLVTPGLHLGTVSPFISSRTFSKGCEVRA